MRAPARLMGISMGDAIAAAFVATFPDLVDNEVVLMASELVLRPLVHGKRHTVVNREAKCNVEAKHRAVDHLRELGWSQILGRLLSWLRKLSIPKELAKKLMLRRHSANFSEMWQARKSVRNVRMIFGVWGVYDQLYDSFKGSNLESNVYMRRLASEPDHRYTTEDAPVHELVRLQSAHLPEFSRAVSSSLGGGPSRGMGRAKGVGRRVNH
ncbi:hypothetical protein DFH09DRAFT_1069526 [Mycena vulgaris]|nr:hypothetical protein DFH09DRAFT_1069526 [Mycena vulgaris]